MAGGESRGAGGAPPGLHLDLEGALGPATRDYVQRGLQRAATEGAELALLRPDTPGGLAASMRDIVMGILASPLPVVSCVQPQSARTASAGTDLRYASHVAAMTPAAHLGAATPIAIAPPRARRGQGGELAHGRLGRGAQESE